MYDYEPILTADKPAPGAMSAQLRAHLSQFVTPLLTRLDAQVDLRLVRTFRALLEVLVLFRHRNQGLLLSELGGWLLAPAQAPAGTKRLSNLLRSRKWKADLITQFLWEQAAQRAQVLRDAGQEVLVLWDESVLEKPESQHLEGLGPVRSSKGRRLLRPKKGCWRKPGPPLVVPGTHWLALLVAGASGPPLVATMRWFTLAKRRPSAEALADPAEPADPAAATDPPPAPAPGHPEGPATGEASAEEAPPHQAADLRTLQQEVLGECLRHLGRAVLHVWDRGYAGSPWLQIALAHRARFVLRWPKSYQLLDAAGSKRAAWQITRGQRSWGHRSLWDPTRRCYVRVGVLARRVRHPDYPHPLWLVVVRSRGKSEPWYLLTSEPIHTEADAWRIARAYQRRWQIELAFRYEKSELALESPRLRQWESRQKLLLIVTLVYAFLLLLLLREFRQLREWLLRHYCHRTGRRLQATAAPLYRLRTALGRLWLASPVAPTSLLENPG
jgi:hypothetical protein